MYEVFLTRNAQKFYQSADAPLARRLNRCLDRLRRNPYRHPNTKRLRGRQAGFLRYRVGDWRVVYRVEEDKNVVTVITITHRSKAYR